MLKLKPGVRIIGLRPEIMLAVQVAASVYDKFGYDCVITSGTDGSHSRGSLHYAGQAVDLRTWIVNVEHRRPIRDEIAAALGGDFDVVLESNHIHVEYQPKEPY